MLLGSFIKRDLKRFLHTSGRSVFLEALSRGGALDVRNPIFYERVAWAKHLQRPISDQFVIGQRKLVHDVVAIQQSDLHLKGLPWSHVLQQSNTGPNPVGESKAISPKCKRTSASRSWPTGSGKLSRLYGVRARRSISGAPGANGARPCARHCRDAARIAGPH